MASSVSDPAQSPNPTPHDIADAHLHLDSRILAMLQSASLAIAELRDPAAIGARIVEVTETLMPVDSRILVAVYLNEDGPRILAHSARGHDAKLLPPNESKRIDAALRADQSRGIIARALRTGETVRSGDTRQLPDFVDVYDDVKSCLCVPAIARGAVVGAINAESVLPDVFSPREEAILNIVTNQLAVAIDNYRLLAKVGEELALRTEAEARFRDFAETAADWYWETGLENEFTYFGGQSEVLGVRQEDIVGRTREAVHVSSEFDARMWQCYLDAVRERKPFENIPFGWRHPDGEKLRITISGKPVFDHDGAFKGYRGVGRDVTERHLAEVALRRSASSLAEAQRIAHIGDWEWDIGARMMRCSDELVRILGDPANRKERTFDEFLAVVHPQDRDLVNARTDQAIAGCSSYRAEYRILRPDGEVRTLNSLAEVDCDETGAPVRLIGVTQDVTEQRRLEETNRQNQLKLLQASKMTALGTLVSGVAHEINNPNNLIMMNAELLRAAWEGALTTLDDHAAVHGEPALLGSLPYAEMREVIPDLIQDLHDASVRIKRIIEDLRDYSLPPQDSVDSTANVNDAVDSACRLMAHVIAKRTTAFSRDLRPDLPLARVDARRVEQIVVNLVMNALEALPKTDRAASVITRLDPDEHRIVLTVEDEGEGMPAEHVARLFEPFFTTRQSTGASGLGLYMTYNLVREVGGTIDVTSVPGRGTTVRVTLPAAVD